MLLKMVIRQVTASAFRNVLIWLLIIAQLAAGFSGIARADDTQSVTTRTVTIPQAIEEAADWIVAQGPVTDDWYAYALAAAGRTVESGYAASAEERVGGFTDQTLPTTYAKTVLGLRAAGENPASFAGVNLLEKIYNDTDLLAQGSNGLIYGLLALSGGSDAVPADAVWTVDEMISTLLEKQIPNQGWALFDSDNDADIDLTGAALWALAPYRDRADVANAVSAAAAWFASKQQDNGDVTTNHSNSNSLSMAILGLSSQQIDGRQGSFSNSGGNLISALFTYMNADGGFSFEAGDGSDGFSTYQALLALAAFDSLTLGQGGEYEVPLSDGQTQGEASVYIHIETPDTTLAEGTETAATPFEALQLIAARNNLDIEPRTDPFFDVFRIGDVVKNTDDGNYHYWGFNIKRDGHWTGDWDWNNTELQDGDEIAVFYGPYGASALLDSIELIPSAPKNNEPFTVRVSQFSGVDSVTAAVYVEVGDQRVWTGSDGEAEFPDGYDAEDRQISVTGALVDGFPTVIRGVKQLPPTVSVVVEGPDGTIASGAERGNTVYEALENTVTEVVYSEETDFSVDEINGIETEGNYKWDFAVHRNGDWAETGAWNTTAVQAGDEVLVYYSTLDTQLVKNVTVSPTVPKAGQSFTVRVEQENWLGAPPASGVDVKIGAASATTDEEGIAAFSGMPAAGTYNLTITGYRDGSAPKLVKFVSSMTVGPAGTGGSAAPPAAPAVTFGVDGGTAKGTILSARRVALESGDTAYSVLVRTLGAGRVQSSGSGSSLYVSEIDGLREYDNGPLSGWVYSVNCTFPSSSAGSYAVKTSDRVMWWYTLNGGDDAKARCASSPGGGGSAPAFVANPVNDLVFPLDIRFDNTQPADPNVRTVVVLNRTSKMSAEQVQQLQRELASNKVALQRMVTGLQETTLADGKQEVSLQIPAGALSEAANISVEELGTDGRDELLSSMYEFLPSGTVFDQPVYISVKMPVVTDRYDMLALAWLNEETNEWIPIPAVYDAQTGLFTGVVNHFTKFAVIDKAKLAAARPTDVSSAIEGAVEYVLADGELSDWEAYALFAAGVAVPGSYLTAVEKQLIEREGMLRNVTDYERLAIGVKAAGGDPRHAAGYDLIGKIVNSERMTVQGTNGPIFALVALDNRTSSLPANALWNEEKLIEWLLRHQNSDGGWPLAPGEASQVDLTAMAIFSLAPYQSSESVKKATERALGWLSQRQLPNGGFQLGGQENSESAAQVLLAMSALKIGESDPQFVKSGNTVVANLLSYQQDDGGFAHLKGDASSGIPTEQALLALAMYRNMTEQPAPANPDIQFADAADISSWALDYVNKAAAYGLMEGVSDEVQWFAPQERLTRAQFVAMILRLKGIAPDAAAKPVFTDVQPGSWHFGYVAKAAELGLVNGLSEHAFAPDRGISRQDMALVLSRAFALPTPQAADDAPFTDLNEAYASAVPAIGAVYAHGYMEGDEHNRFLPTASVTREMAAAVMVRAYEKQ